MPQYLLRRRRLCRLVRPFLPENPCYLAYHENLVYHEDLAYRPIP